MVLKFERTLNPPSAIPVLVDVVPQDNGYVPNVCHGTKGVRARSGVITYKLSSCALIISIRERCLAMSTNSNFLDIRW